MNNHKMAQDPLATQQTPGPSVQAMPRSKLRLIDTPDQTLISPEEEISFLKQHSPAVYKLPSYIMCTMCSNARGMLEQLLKDLVNILAVKNTQRSNKQFLLDRILGTRNFSFYGSVLVNLYREERVSAQEAVELKRTF